MIAYLRPSQITRRAMVTALAALLGGALLGTSADATAGTVVQQRNFDLFAATPPLYGSGGAAAAHYTLLDFSRFDPAMGTLTGAHWYLESWLIATAIGHVSSTSTDLNELAEGEVNLHLQFGAPHLVGTANTGAFLLDHGFGFDCSTSLAQGTCDMHLDFSEAIDGDLEATVLSEFLGLGSFHQTVGGDLELHNVAHTAAADVTSSAAFHYFGAPGTSFGGRLALVYDFDEPTNSVPEPASLLLVSLALYGAAAARRRSRAL